MPMITWLQLIALPWSTSSTYLHYYLSILLFHITPHYITIVTCPVYLFCSARTSEHSMPLSKPTFLSKVYLFHQRPCISPPLPANPSTGNQLFACECASRVFFLSMSCYVVLLLVVVEFILISCLHQLPLHIPRY